MFYLGNLGYTSNVLGTGLQIFIFVLIGLVSELDQNSWSFILKFENCGLVSLFCYFIRVAGNLATI